MTQRNRKLKNLIKLSSSVRVYVPTTVNTDEARNTESTRREVEKSLSEWFGGATSYSAMGCWVSTDVGLVREKVTIVESHTTTKGLEDHIEDVVALAEEMKLDLSQEAVAIEVNGELYLV